MASMTLHEVMRELESLGTEQSRKIYRRHGAGEPLFGVSFAHLRALRNRLKQDQPLARQLWATGNTDARLLACLIAEPRAMDDAEVERWMAEIEATRYYA